MLNIVQAVLTWGNNPWSIVIIKAPDINPVNSNVNQVKETKFVLYLECIIMVTGR